jgi:transcription elongation factor SPT6
MGIFEASKKLRDMAMEGPYRPDSLRNIESRFIVPTGDLRIVGICCSSDPKEATYLAAVNEVGVLQDRLIIPGGTHVGHPKHISKIEDFLFNSRPAAVLVGTSGGMQSRSVQRKMKDIVNTAVNHWGNRDIQGDDEDDEEFEARLSKFDKYLPSRTAYDDEEESLDWKCNADLIDDSVSQVFAHSPRGKKEFPDLPPNLRAAISIARYGKDPVAEIAYSWNVASDSGLFGTELLYFDIHPMQQLLKRFKGPSLLRHYERVLCDVVADIGVDVNKSCEFDHLLGLLTFVPGLGPRKAADIKQKVTQRGTPIATRRSLLEDRLVGPTVYNNSVAFLRISYFDDDLRQSTMHPLDNTRLHPDVYAKNNFAIKIAMDALERVENTRGGGDSAIKALRDVLEDSRREVDRLYDAYKKEHEVQGLSCNVTLFKPRTIASQHWKDKVEELDLEAYANMIEENGNGKWLSHLEMIKWEFRMPFADPREPMKILNGEKQFRLLTNETDQSLRPGKEITVTIQQNGDYGSKVKLEGSIPGFIALQNLADENVESADDVVAEGTPVNAIVLEVKKDHFSVDLSLKMEDLRKPPSSWQRPQSLPQIDMYYDTRASRAIEEKKKLDRDARLELLRLKTSSKLDATGEDGTKRQVGRVARRACAHPAFRNAKGDEVDSELKSGGLHMVGDSLIRPSSRAADCLAIHWLYRPDHTKIIEVKEEDKSNDASIGNKLKIKGETYESIDEMLGRYIAPMNDYVEELINHRKFLDLPEDEIDNRLKNEKRDNPMGIPYQLCWMEDHPGYATLRFILSQTPRHYVVGITPNGFVLGTKPFSSLDLLINDFKKNPRAGSTSSGRTASRPQGSSQGGERVSRWGNRQQPPPPALPAGYSNRPPPPPGPPPQPHIRPPQY